MNIIWAIFLGIVQGLTELFPISSSAHLTLLPWLFKYPDPGLAFDIALHAGTLLALTVALWPDWSKLIKAVPNPKATKERKLILFLILTSVPGALLGFFLEKNAETVFRNPLLISGTLILFGLVLYFVDRLQIKQDTLEKMTAGKSLLIGFSQALALIPGVSRSGATVTAGRSLGFSRETAVRYSFLAAAPIIFGATIFGLRNVTVAELFSLGWLFGFLAAFAASFWAIRFLLSFVKTRSFAIFFYYRLFLGILVILIFLVRR